jgi:transcriptional regulator with XRE-family HTH domain
MIKEPLTDINQRRHLELCSLLRNYRINFGYTQAQLAEEIGLSRNSISKIENQGWFRIQHLYLLADFYDIPLNELFQDIE